MGKLFLAGIGGFIGSTFRYAVTGFVQNWSRSIDFPTRARSWRSSLLSSTTKSKKAWPRWKKCGYISIGAGSHPIPDEVSTIRVSGWVRKATVPRRSSPDPTRLRGWY